jgi:hypothetical protein
MQNNQDLQQELRDEKGVRASAMAGGIVAAVVAVFFIIGVAMWYDGWFSEELGVAVAPSNPAAGDSAAAPAARAAPSGTVGQTPQTPAPAQTGR